MKKLLLCCLACFQVACASFSSTYSGVGAAGDAAAYSNEAASRFSRLESPSPQDAAAIEKVQIYTTSIPPVLVVNGNTIATREGVNAVLLGSVLVGANLQQPTETEVVPVLQRAAYAGGANLAYCPTEGINWRCYLVRVGDDHPVPRSGQAEL